MSEEVAGDVWLGDGSGLGAKGDEMSDIFIK